jgi:DNA-binding NarL/FixJ family response regulator
MHRQGGSTVASVADPVDIAAQQIEIVLADDHAMIRGGLRRVLDAETGLSVVAEAGDVEAALRLTRTHKPRVVVLDLNMPGAPTLPAIPELLAAAPDSAVVVLTMEADPRFAREALSAGAQGYVLKEAAEAQLVEAVRSVAAGRTYLDPSLGARLASNAAQSRPGLSDSVSRLAVGSNFAGHRIEAVVGRGGGGLVFRAIDLALERPVALKVIAPELAGDPSFRARFERESRLAAAIDHPHVVEVFHAGEANGLLYLTMRYVDGTDVRMLLRQEERLDPARAVAIVAQVGGALDEAHALGLIHRDVKPANILIAQRAEGEHAYLTDFGITKRAAEESVTRTGVTLGTVDYIAPEQAEGATVDGRADVYSLACVLFEMLTGTVVFEQGSDLEKLWAHVHKPAPTMRSVNPALPEELEPVLARALAKRPEERQASAGELARSARSALGA